MTLKRPKISLFYPYVSKEMKRAAIEALGEKMIGQGTKVDQFERLLSLKLGTNNLLTVNSGTSALDLAYHLLDLKPGDEVITPVFGFAGAYFSLLRRGVKIVFSDIKDNLLIDWDDVLKKISPRTKAIINVHLFGQLSKSRKLPIPIIGDAAQYLGKTRGERFTAYSFQATKFLTTVDGGALVCKQLNDYKRGKLLRWYGIDRDSGKANVEVDIREAGYKYNMNNVTAAIGLAALPNLPKRQAEIQFLQKGYYDGLKNIPGIKAIGGSPFLIHTESRTKLVNYLAGEGIEAGLNLRRNDIYTIFGGRRQNLPNMNRLEKSYLLLPCHNKMGIEDVEVICEAIKKSL